MTSKQCVLTSINHQQPDRTPITFDAEKEVYASLHQHLGTKTKEELFDRLHVDTWMLLPNNFIFGESESDKETKTALWGYKTRVAQYSGGTYDELCYSPLAGKDDIADVDKYPWPSDDALDFAHFPVEAESHKDRAIIGVFTWGAYFIATFVRGMEDLFTDFALRRNYAHRLIDRISERILFFLGKMLCNHGDGIDIVYMADDYCSQLGPMFSPAFFKEDLMNAGGSRVSKVHEKSRNSSDSDLLRWYVVQAKLREEQRAEHFLKEKG